MRFSFNTTPERSRIMAAIRSKNTMPELTVRKLLRQLGFCGYRIHRKGLPGTPDIAFLGKKKVILIHGCFWHGHDCKAGSRKPKSNQAYWLPKIELNKQRDIANIAKLQQMGWTVLVLWECELNDHDRLSNILQKYLMSPANLMATKVVKFDVKSIQTSPSLD